MATVPLGFNSKSGKQYKVMLVDDSSIIRIAEKKILLSEDFNVVMEADNAMAALKYLREIPEKPDIIMLDFEMPQMNGLDLLKRIRALNYEGKIVVVTSHTNKETFLEFVNLKVDTYIAKPIQRQIIIAHLARILGRFDYL